MVMGSALSDKVPYVPCKMDFYIDRIRDNYMDIAESCAEGILVLWDSYCLEINEYKGNIFQYEFNGNDVVMKKEYLFTMDYLTNVLTAYRNTGDEIFKHTFKEIIIQYHEYLEMNEPVYDELPIYGQTLLFIKALDIFGDIPYQSDFIALLIKYADWLMEDNNYIDNNNHGIFEDLALLHISVLLDSHPKAVLWKKQAVKRLNRLFEVAYYDDFTNNENSIRYFEINNNLYGQVIQFCENYSISGIDKLKERLEKSTETLITFSHKDCSFPLIGDGRIFYGKESNQDSRLFPDIGIGILKIKETYMSFKCKTVFQAHAHIDVSSITARYKNIDFIIDSGQYNYDRYTPANRYMRSSAGHSGIFPVFADNMFQKEFCDSLEYSDIIQYKCNGTNAYMKGEYKLKDVSVCREIFVSSNEIIIKDNWCSERPAVMRQRFVIPKELIKKSRFTVSKRTLESEVGDVKFKMEITSDLTDILTVVQFGIAAPQYNVYEETMLLDTFAENALSGGITAKLTFKEDR